MATSAVTPACRLRLGLPPGTGGRSGSASTGHLRTLCAEDGTYTQHTPTLSVRNFLKLSLYKPKNPHKAPRLIVTELDLVLPSPFFPLNLLTTSACSASPDTLHSSFAARSCVSTACLALPVCSTSARLAGGNSHGDD